MPEIPGDEYDVEDVYQPITDYDPMENTIQEYDGDADDVYEDTDSNEVPVKKTILINLNYESRRILSLSGHGNGFIWKRSILRC